MNWGKGMNIVERSGSWFFMVECAEQKRTEEKNACVLGRTLCLHLSVLCLHVPTLILPSARWMSMVLSYRPPLHSLPRLFTIQLPLWVSTILKWTDIEKFRQKEGPRNIEGSYYKVVAREHELGVKETLEGHLSSLLSCASSNNFGLGKSHLVSFPVISSRTEEERN